MLALERVMEEDVAVISSLRNVKGAASAAAAASRKCSWAVISSTAARKRRLLATRDVHAKIGPRSSVYSSLLLRERQGVSGMVYIYIARPSFKLGQSRTCVV